MSDARTHLAWLIWCYGQGYIKPEDRDILTNWLLDDDASLTKNDVVTKHELLAAADEVLTALAAGVEGDQR